MKTDQSNRTKLSVCMFWKYEGLGNDFILFREREQAIAKEEKLTPQRTIETGLTPSLIRRICHRSTGIGADGIIILFIDPLASPPYRIKIFNSDGSCAKMCGNGVRCVAQFIFDTEWKASEAFSSGILTDAGIVFASVSSILSCVLISCIDLC
jgi:diaminopimelate epimerase